MAKWRKVKLADVCKFVRGPFGGSLKKDIFVSQGYAVFEQQHAIYGDFNKFRYFVTKDKFNEMQRFKLSPGDLIMSCSGTLGKVALVPEGIPNGIINQALLKLTPTDEVEGSYIKSWFESDLFTQSLRQNSGGAAIQNVAEVRLLKEIQIPLPPLAEQRKIAEILRTWDEAIETAEAELKAKQERKRWLMDKLLVGNWPKRTIEELFELEGSGIDKVILPDEQVVPLVNYMDAYRKRVLKHADVQAETSVSPNDLMRCQLKRGDIVLTPSSETPDDIAHSALINFEPGNAVHSYHLFRLRARFADEIVHDFRAFFLNHISVRRQFIRICSGTTRFTLTLPGVRAIKVSLPPIKHQQYAAEVLNDATSQEELASQRVESLRTQKRGLMQKLLTGEVRVKV